MSQKYTGDRDVNAIRRKVHDNDPVTPAEYRLGKLKLARIIVRIVENCILRGIDVGSPPRLDDVIEGGVTDKGTFKGLEAVALYLIYDVNRARVPVPPVTPVFGAVSAMASKMFRVHSRNANRDSLVRIQKISAEMRAESLGRRERFAARLSEGEYALTGRPVRETTRAIRTALTREIVDRDRKWAGEILRLMEESVRAHAARAAGSVRDATARFARFQSSPNFSKAQSTLTYLEGLVTRNASRNASQNTASRNANAATILVRARRAASTRARLTDIERACSDLQLLIEKRSQDLVVYQKASRNAKTRQGNAVNNSQRRNRAVANRAARANPLAARKANVFAVGAASANARKNAKSTATLTRLATDRKKLANALPRNLGKVLDQMIFMYKKE